MECSNSNTGVWIVDKATCLVENLYDFKCPKCNTITRTTKVAGLMATGCHKHNTHVTMYRPDVKAGYLSDTEQIEVTQRWLPYTLKRIVNEMPRGDGEFAFDPLNDEMISEAYVGFALALKLYHHSFKASAGTYVVAATMMHVRNYLRSASYNEAQGFNRTRNLYLQYTQGIEYAVDAEALNPEEQLIQKEDVQENIRITTNVLRSTLKTLDERERYILRNCIMGKKTNVSVAERFDCSEGMIRYLIKKIKKILKSKGDKMYDKIQNADL